MIFNDIFFVFPFPHLLSLGELVVVQPFLSDTHIYGHGEYRRRSRYKCKICKKTFNDNTGTAIDGIKKVSEFQSYINLLMMSISLQKAVDKLGVNVGTVFTWRHKLLSSLSCICSLFEKHIVFLLKRFKCVLKFKFLRSIFHVFSLPTRCIPTGMYLEYEPQSSV